MLAETASKYQTQAEMQAETIRRLNSDLKSLEAKETARGITLTLGDVLFATGRSELKPGAERKLGPLATYLREHPQERISIGGHTDNVGTKKYNKLLSEKRAESVKNWLVKRGVDASRILSIGYGMDKPIVPNTSKANRQKNRRCEIKQKD